MANLGQGEWWVRVPCLRMFSTAVILSGDWFTFARIPRPLSGGDVIIPLGDLSLI